MACILRMARSVPYDDSQLEEQVPHTYSVACCQDVWTGRVKVLEVHTGVVVFEAESPFMQLSKDLSALGAAQRHCRGHETCEGCRGGLPFFRFAVYELRLAKVVVRDSNGFC